MSAIVVKNIDNVLPSCTAEYELLKAQALVVCRAVVAVTEAESQQIAVSAVGKIKGLLKMVETSRVDVKAPVLKLCKDIDAFAKALVAELEEEAGRIEKTLIRPYVQVEQEKAAARQRLADDLARKQREKAEAQAREAEAERQRFLREAQAATSAAEAQALAAAAQAKAEEAAAATERMENTQARVVAAPAKAAGMTVRKVWRFEVTDIAALYKARPSLCVLQESASAINAEMRGGMRQCAGLRIWEEVGTTVRA